MRIFFSLSAVVLLSLVLISNGSSSSANTIIQPDLDRSPIRASPAISGTTFLPLIIRNVDDSCAAIPGETYGTLPIDGNPTDRPADVHPDINLAIRSYVATTGFKGLLDGDNPHDPKAPQLAGLFGDNRVPTFATLYQVYDWDWTNYRRGNLIADPPVSMAGMGVAQSEIIHVPNSGFLIGAPQPRLSNYQVLVLYATAQRVTLKYTQDDNVVYGYTIHLENICVEPILRALYDSMNVAGRHSLPALRGGQGIGRARGNEIGVVIRDAGTFMDPRSRGDWWQGR